MLHGLASRRLLLPSYHSSVLQDLRQQRARTADKKRKQEVNRTSVMLHKSTLVCFLTSLPPPPPPPPHTHTHTLSLSLSLSHTHTHTHTHIHHMRASAHRHKHSHTQTRAQTERERGGGGVCGCYWSVACCQCQPPQTMQVSYNALARKLRWVRTFVLFPLLCVLESEGCLEHRDSASLCGRKGSHSGF